jgi:hypothetical protein
VPLYRLLQNCAFEPDTITAMGNAFDAVCQKLGLANTDDPLRELVAKKVIELAQQGENKSDQLRDRTLEHFGAP